MECTSISLQEFKRWALLDENTGREYEFINGVIIEASPGRTSNSEIGHRIAFAVRLFCRENNLPCHTSGGESSAMSSCRISLINPHP